MESIIPKRAGDNIEELLLLDYYYDDNSKQSTQQERYEDVFKYKTQLRRENHNLKRQLETIKQQILSKALGIYLQQIRQLSEYNQKLREQHHKIMQKKNKPKNQQILQNSGLSTPKSRRSIIKICDSGNNGGLTDRSQPEQREKGLIFGRKSLNFKNNQNIQPGSKYGRNSLKSKGNENRYSQLTERKTMGNILNVSCNSFSKYENISECNSRKGSLKNSLKSSINVNKSQNFTMDNIFTNFIQTMLTEQKQKQRTIEQFLKEYAPHHKNNSKNQGIEISELENEITKTSKNIEQMEKILIDYEIQIKETQINIESVSSMMREVSKLKENFIMMREQCRNIPLLRNQVSIRAKKLSQLKTESNIDGPFDPPQSIRVLLRLLGVQEGQTRDPTSCRKKLKAVVRGKLEKPSKRKVKVRQLLDNIRQGRKKFKELMEVYYSRINKIQKKIKNLQFLQKPIN